MTKEQKPNGQPKADEADGTVKPAEAKPANQTTTPVPPKQAPPPPVESKPDVAAALAPAHPVAAQAQPIPAVKTAPTGPKSGRIIPAVPLQSPAQRAAVPPTSAAPSAPAAAQAGQVASTAAQQYQDATRAATAAVAAAMAKLGPAPGQAPSQKAPQSIETVDNLAKKVSEMRTDDRIRHSKQPGTGGYAAGHRGGRGGGGRGRGAHHGHPPAKPVEVPTTDFDFESSNAKFNKQDLVKEAIATGSPLGTPGESSAAAPNGSAEANGTHQAADAGAAKHDDVVIPPPAEHKMYDKSTSFFDNISSEIKDRDESGRRGQEFRSEERKKNLETFGQGSVDSYRGGYRGRGRGRGFGRGRGGFAPRGRGAPRGAPRGGQPLVQDAA